MKFLIFIITLNIIFITNVSSEQNKSCKELVDKPIKWSKCVKNKSIDEVKDLNGYCKKFPKSVIIIFDNVDFQKLIF